MQSLIYLSTSTQKKNPVIIAMPTYLPWSQLCDQYIIMHWSDILWAILKKECNKIQKHVSQLHGNHDLLMEMGGGLN